MKTVRAKGAIMWMSSKQPDWHWANKWPADNMFRHLKDYQAAESSHVKFSCEYNSTAAIAQMGNRQTCLPPSVNTPA